MLAYFQVREARTLLSGVRLVCTILGFMIFELSTVMDAWICLVILFDICMWLMQV